MSHALKSDWGYKIDLLKGPVFGDYNEGISRTYNYRDSQIQSKYNDSVGHKVFSNKI